MHVHPIRSLLIVVAAGSALAMVGTASAFPVATAPLRTGTMETKVDRAPGPAQPRAVMARLWVSRYNPRRTKTTRPMPWE